MADESGKMIPEKIETHLVAKRSESEAAVGSNPKESEKINQGSPQVPSESEKSVTESPCASSKSISELAGKFGGLAKPDSFKFAPNPNPISRRVSSDGLSSTKSAIPFESVVLKPVRGHTESSASEPTAKPASLISIPEKHTDAPANAVATADSEITHVTLSRAKPKRRVTVDGGGPTTDVKNILNSADRLHSLQEAAAATEREADMAEKIMTIAPQVEKALFWCKGTRFVTVRSVPLKAESMNGGDVFVLLDISDGLVVQWSGASASGVEKVRGAELCQRFKMHECRGRAKVFNLDEGDDDCIFWDRVSVGEIPPAESVLTDSDAETDFIGSILAEKIRQDGQHEIFKAPLHGSMLDETCVFVVSSKYANRIYLWVGRKAAAELTRTGKMRAEQLHHTSPASLGVERMRQGDEPTLFRFLFSSWGATVDISKALAAGKATARLLTHQKKNSKKNSEGGEHQRKMFQVKGKKTVRIFEVRCAAASMNDGDVFILSAENKVFQFNGKFANLKEKARAAEFCRDLGKGTVFVLESDGAGGSASHHYKTFWRHVCGRCKNCDEAAGVGDIFEGPDFVEVCPTVSPHKIKSADSGGDDGEIDEAVAASVELFVCRAREGSLGRHMEDIEMENVLSRPLERSLLMPGKAYVLIWKKKQIFIWVSRSAAESDKEAAITVALNFQSEWLTEGGEGVRVEIEHLPEHSESPLFKSQFNSWKGISVDFGKVQMVGVADTRSLTARASTQKILDVYKNTMTHASSISLATDDGLSGEKKIFLILNSKLVEIDAERLRKGFFSGDCYVMHYSWLPGVAKSQSPRHLLYAWQGMECPLEDRGASSLLLNEIIGNLPDKQKHDKMVIRQSKETRHFIAACGGILIIRRGMSVENLKILKLRLAHRFKSQLESQKSQKEREAERQQGSKLYGELLAKLSKSAENPIKSRRKVEGAAAEDEKSPVEKSDEKPDENPDKTPVENPDEKCAVEPDQISSDEKDYVFENSKYYENDGENWREILFQIRALHDENLAVATEFPFSHGSLLPASTFAVLVRTGFETAEGKKYFVIWQGEGAPKFEIDLARKCISNFTAEISSEFPGGDVCVVEQGSEPSWFQKILRNVAAETPPVSSDLIAEEVSAPIGDMIRVFVLKSAGEAVVATEINHASYDDFDSTWCLLVDAVPLRRSPIFIWVGAQTSAKYAAIAKAWGREYFEIATEETRRKCELVAVTDGEEPDMFRSIIFGWPTTEQRRQIFSLQSQINERVDGVAPAAATPKKSSEISTGKITTGASVAPAGSKLDELSDEKFEEALGVTREKYNTLPEWKKTQLRKSSGWF